MTGREVTVRIDQIAVGVVDERRAQQAEEVVRKALALLAGRLASAPLGLGDRAPELVLERLDLGPLDPAWIRSPGAAERLADDLLRSILRGGDRS